MDQDQLRLTLLLAVCIFGAYGGVIGIKKGKIQTKLFGTVYGRKAKAVGIFLIINGFAAVMLWLVLITR